MVIGFIALLQFVTSSKDFDLTVPRTSQIITGRIGLRSLLQPFLAVAW
jgi:hypothetical protein